MNFSFGKQLPPILQSLFYTANRVLSLATICLVALLFIAVNTQTIYAQDEPSKSYKIKAGFLLQLTSYVTWPSSNQNNNGETDINKKNNIEICIVGHDPFGAFIDEMVTVRPTTDKGQRIIIRRLTVKEPLVSCRVVFITERSIDYDFWQSLPPNHTYLLVSEYNGFLQNGGMISLKENKKRIQLNIHLQNAKDKKIIISPELLRVSTIITTLAPKE